MAMNTSPRASLEPLGLIGGFLDAVGGGGWGPGGDVKPAGARHRAPHNDRHGQRVRIRPHRQQSRSPSILTLGFKAFTVATIGLIIGGLLCAAGAVIAKRIPGQAVSWPWSARC